MKPLGLDPHGGDSPLIITEIAPRQVIVHSDATTVQPPAKKTRGKGGRKKSPQVQARNRRIVADEAKGLDVGDLCDKYHVSAVLVRRILSDARKRRQS